MFEMEMVICTFCPFCGKDYYITVDFNDYEKWQAGELIQNAFPYLSANEREALKTGICAECWDKMVSFDDEEEEEEFEEDCEPEEFDYDFRDEIGFNPYMGCYNWDC